MIALLVYVVIVALIGGVAAYLINRAPFIDEPFKSWAVWLILAVVLIIIVIKLADAAGVSLA